MIKSASPAKEIIEQMVKTIGYLEKAGRRKSCMPIAGIIEEGLKKDGEVRVKGLGTFPPAVDQGKRLGAQPQNRWAVEIPSHNRVIFLREQAI